MANKQLRRLRRAELVEIIYELQKNEAALKEARQEAQSQIETLTRENADLLARCQDREYKISQAGSIAEAMAGVSDIFRKSQEMADEYLENVRRLELRAKQALLDAQAQAQQIIAAAEQEAQLRAAQTLTQAENEVSSRWQEFDRQVKQAMKAHSELREMLCQFQEVPNVSEKD